MNPIAVTVSELPFDQRELEQARDALELPVGAVGAEVCFVGRVRAQGDRPAVTGLYLEHYPAMTVQRLTQQAGDALERFGLLGVVVWHRVGRIALGEPVVGVLTLSAHREAAFWGAEFLMDYLKHDAPFWKQELTADGAMWVEPKDSDQAAFKRWKA